MKRQHKTDWLLAHKHLLNPWELDFTATISARLEMGDGITPRQARKLDQTFIKCTNMLPPEKRPAEVVSLKDWKRESLHGHK